MKKLIMKMFVYFLIASGLNACGSGTDSNVFATTAGKSVSTFEVTAEKKTTGSLKLSIVGELPQALFIGGVRVKLELPVGVTVDTVPTNGPGSPLTTAPGVFTLVGTSTSSLSVVAFKAATAYSPAMVEIAIINVGMNTQHIEIVEFATLNCKILPDNPTPTVADFVLRETEIIGTDSSLVIVSLVPWVKVIASFD